MISENFFLGCFIGIAMVCLLVSTYRILREYIHWYIPEIIEDYIVFICIGIAMMAVIIFQFGVKL